MQAFVDKKRKLLRKNAFEQKARRGQGRVLGERDPRLRFLIKVGVYLQRKTRNSKGSDAT